MSNNITIVNALPEEKWRRFVEEHPAGNIFHTPEMFRVFAKTRKHWPSLWAVVNDNNYPLAILLPVQVTLMDGLLHRFTTRSIVYGSVICALNPEGKQALRLLLRTYKQEIWKDSLFTELRNLSDLSDLDLIFNEQGYEYEEYLNYLINLDRPAEEVFQNIGKRTRKQIRRGLRRKDVEMDEVTNRSELHDWYNTLQKTYSNAQVPLADRSMFEAAFDELYSKNMAKFLLAKVNGVIAACSVELLYKDVIYGWYGGLSRSYSKYLPNELLIWHILEWGANNNYRIYDFGGAGKPDEEYGVRDFKAKFGGELVSYGRYTYIHSPHHLRLSQLGYKLYRHFL